MKDDNETQQSYCGLRADNSARWAFIQQHLDDDYQTALDIGCAEGYFTNAAAEFGLVVMGIEADEDRYAAAMAAFGDRENVEFRCHRITPENVSDLPSTDITLLLTVQHHWVGAYGIDNATRMLKVVGGKTDLLFYEPPGTMFLSKTDPIQPTRSVSKYGNYLLNLFDGAVKIRDVELFDYVNEREYADRRDPLFAVDTSDVEKHREE